MTRPGRLFTAMLIATSVFAPLSASAAHAAPGAADAAQCILSPGAYGIVNSKGDLVGMLIVYPDCSTEIVPARDI